MPTRDRHSNTPTPSQRFVTKLFALQVVNVWEYVPKERKAVLKRPLYGHTEPVTCLAASQAYNVIVSGSRDRTCIIWDMSRLIFVHQLRGHIAPVAAVTVNELTVSAVTTSEGSVLFNDALNTFYLERERNVLFNNALNTFYLRLYGVRHMIKDHSDSEKGNPLPPHRLLLSINSKGSFICTIPQTG